MTAMAISLHPRDNPDLDLRALMQSLAMLEAVLGH